MHNKSKTGNFSICYFPFVSVSGKHGLNAVYINPFTHFSVLPNGWFSRPRISKIVRPSEDVPATVTALDYNARSQRGGNLSGHFVPDYRRPKRRSTFMHAYLENPFPVALSYLSYQLYLHRSDLLPTTLDCESNGPIHG
jgi:hypothetical protein